MAGKIEFLNGGLVTSREPSLLNEGELSRCTNGVYKQNSQSLFRAPGRVTFGAVAAGSAVNGLTDLKFDNASHFLVAHATASYYHATVGDSGSFTLTESLTASGNYLESIHFSNKYFMLNGAAANRVWYLPSTLSTVPSTRRHGLLPVNAPPAVVTAAGAFSQTADGFYEYWTTEVAKFTKDSDVLPFTVANCSATNNSKVLTTTGDFVAAGVAVGDRITHAAVPPGNLVVSVVATSITSTLESINTISPITLTFSRGIEEELESTFGADPFDPQAVDVSPATVNVTSVTTQKVTVTRPSQVNSEATHWRVYRSAKKGTETEQLFPRGFQLGADIPMETVSVDDGSASATSPTSPANVVQVLGSAGTWTIPAATAVQTDDNVYATSPNLGSIVSGIFSEETSVVANQFGFTTVTDPIRGVVVTVRAKLSSLFTGLYRPQMFVRLRQTPQSGSRTARFFTSGSLTTSELNYTVPADGSTSNLWGADWLNAALLNSNNFSVIVGVISRNPTYTGSLEIEQVSVTVYHGGTPVTSVIPFPFLEVQVENATVGVGSHGPPPSASTGDVFEDTLVTNDIAFPSFLRWSLPTEPEYFPWPYFLSLETRDNDIVTYIRSLGGRVVAGTRNSLWRINYLPTAEDATFNRGKALDLISNDNGIVNPKAAALFTDSTGRVRLAFVSANGIYSTDGFTISQIIPDLDFNDIFTASGSNMFTAGAVLLENDPVKWELKLFLIGTGALYRLHYHPSHVKEGGYMKVSGPQDLTHSVSGNSFVRAARTLVRGTGDSSTYFGYNGASANGGGSVYRQTDSAFAVPFADPSTLYRSDVRTRQMYNAGIGGEWKLDRLYINHGSTGATLTVAADVSRTGSTESSAVASATFTPNFVGMSKLDLGVSGEATRLRLTDGAGTSDWKLNYLALDSEDFDEEES